MPARSDLSDDVLRRLSASELTRTRLEALYVENQVLLADLEAVYRGLFLQNVTAFEAFLERLFYGIVSGTVAYPSRVQLRVTFPRGPLLRLFVLGGKDYVDWLPYARTADRASMYVAGGRPFSDLEEPLRQSLHRIHYVRNVIAHDSRHAKEQFSKKVIGNTPLLGRERTASGYLRSRPAPRGPTRFELMMNDLARAARTLCR